MTPGPGSEETVPVSPAAAAGDDRPFATPLAGQRIGPYEILSEIGRGGMGVVYLAARADQAFEKKVAIKLVKRGMDSEEILARFRHERQILAALDHPHIARLIDGGTSPDGRPYFVMEYIEGLPLFEYCDQHRLSVGARLALFRKVCSAVQYAHQNLVVHRDLKPGNILVTADGTPKLLDFGIAKLLTPSGLDQATISPAARPMTPAYASPEQILGQPVTTASDVYSLGVILYELLAGNRPYDVPTKSFEELERLVCHTEPERPSTAARKSTSETAQARSSDPDKLRRRLEGDLDNIVMMALRKDPARRYASVEPFSQDLERHLTGHPVLAREDTIGYRAAKFVQRHRAAVAVAGLFALLLAAFVATVLVQARRIRLERDTAEQVSAFLGDLFKVADPGESKGAQVTARELLDRGADRVGRELTGQPAAQARMMHTIGGSYYGLGLYDRASTMFQKALAIQNRVSGENSGEASQIMVSLASAEIARGNFDNAEPLARKALEIRRRLYRDQGPEVAEAVNVMGQLFYNRRDYPQAEKYYREAIALQERLAIPDDTKLAGFRSDLSDVVKSPDEAEQLLKLALHTERKVNGGAHPKTVSSLNNLANVQLRKKDLEGAEQTFRQAVAAGTKLYGEKNPHVGLYMANLGYVMYARGNLAGAEPVLRRSLAIRRETLPIASPEIGHSELLLGRLLVDQGQVMEAEPMLRETLAIFRQKFTAGNTLTADVESVLGACLAQQRKFAEAEKLLRASLATLDAVKARESRLGKQTMQRLVKLYEAWGKADQAARYRGGA